MIRKYVSDREAFNKILELLEDKEEGQPFFAFEVTMQNHGGYSKTYPDFTPDIKVEEIGETANDGILPVTDQQNG